MSYCVNCGVELHPTAKSCPLCHTLVVNPRRPPDGQMPPPFPSHREEVPPVDRRELVLLLTVLLLSVSLCCGLLNLLFLRTQRAWSLYVIGAAAMLWLWFVPPLLHRSLRLWLRLGLDICAVGVYVFLISIDLHGGDWYVHLALPIILSGGVLAILLGFLLRDHRRSTLTSITLVIGALGLFAFSIEYWVDRWLYTVFIPGWSVMVLVICAAIIVPLIVIRRTPGLREEARRRFHF